MQLIDNFQSVNPNKEESIIPNQAKNTIMFKIKNSNTKIIRTDNIIFNNFCADDKRITLVFPKLTIGGHEHMIMLKIKNKGIEWFINLHGINLKEKNQFIDNIPMLYLIDGELVHEYNTYTEEDGTTRFKEEKFDLKFKNMYPLFIKDNQIDYDGDEHLPKRPELEKLGLEIQKICWDQT